MLGSKIEPPKPTKIKKLGLTGSASSEFAKRFMTKPSRQPKVIDFNAGNLQGEKKRRGINGFFPPMKLRSSTRDSIVKSNDNTDTKVNQELSSQDLYIDGNHTVTSVINLDVEPDDTSNTVSQTQLIPAQESTDDPCKLTPQNLAKRLPKQINIPIVERSDTDESGSHRAHDTNIKFKLPPVTIGEFIENDDRRTNTKLRCAACNISQRIADFPNIWMVHEDFDESEFHLEDFTNALLGHITTINFRFRREWTVCCDRFPPSRRVLELPMIDGVQDDSVKSRSVAKRFGNSLGTQQVELMKYMTREIYTNLKLSKLNSRTKEDRLQLVPTSYSEVRPRSNTSRTMSRASRRSVGMRKTPESVRTAPPHSAESYLPYPDTFDCDDLSALPPPKRVLPKRDVPWVFRYKVKRNMNELAKILASKPPQVIENV